MATLTAIIGFFVAYKAVLLPVFTAFIAWLLPSPLNRAAKAQADTQAAEKKADETHGQVSDLDHLP